MCGPTINATANPTSTRYRKKTRQRRCQAPSPLWLLVLMRPWNVANADQNYATQNQVSRNKGILALERYCRKRIVEVNSLQLTCDSPGAYYQGSKTYRNSEVCIYGDKANIRVYLTISEQLDWNSSIYIQVSAGLYDNFVQVIKPTRLCQMQISSAAGTTQSCPRPGRYLLQSYFNVPDLAGNDMQFHFTPDLNITFTDANYQRLGCAVAGTSALSRQAARHHHIGMEALEFSLIVFGVVFGGLLILAYRRRKRIESLSEKKTKRYQYFRTLPNGQVILISGAGAGVHMPTHQPAYPRPSGAPEEAYHISNPAYNETQLPTRPVI